MTNQPHAAPTRSDNAHSQGQPSPAVTIKTVQDGPLQVKGPIELVDHDGNNYEVAGKRTVFLCRCGGSTTKPFCDGTHSRIGFDAAERAVAQADAAEVDG